jgi:hypothetical protein
MIVQNMNPQGRRYIASQLLDASVQQTNTPVMIADNLEGVAVQVEMDNPSTAVAQVESTDADMATIIAGNAIWTPASPVINAAAAKQRFVFLVAPSAVRLNVTTAASGATMQVFVQGNTVR